MLINAFFFQILGRVANDKPPLLNYLFKVLECALQSNSLQLRQKAMERWRDLCDRFALDPSVIYRSKRITLVLRMLESTETPTTELKKTQIFMWLNLLDKLGPDASRRFEAVSVPLLKLCFGPLLHPANDSEVSTAKFIKDVMPVSTAVLALMLSEAKKCCTKIARVFRSNIWLNSQDFADHAQELGELVILALTNKSAENNVQESYRIIIRSYLERCIAPSQPLKEHLNHFTYSLLRLVTNQPELMSFILDVLWDSIRSSDRISLSVLPILAKNAHILLIWYTCNQRFSSQQLSTFLGHFFRAGIRWNVAEFTAKISDALAAFPDKNIVSFWFKLAEALLAIPVQ